MSNIPATETSFGGLFSSLDYVHDLLPTGPRLGDAEWDFAELLRAADTSRRLALHTIQTGYQPTARVALLVMGRPTHPRVVRAGIVRRDRPAPLTSLVDAFTAFRVIADWGMRHGLPNFAAWSQRDATEFLTALKAGTHREDSPPLSPGRIRSYVATFKLLHEIAAVLPDPFSFVPFPHASAQQVANVQPRGENVTPPLPWQTWAPLVRGAWHVVADFSDDILRAHQAAEGAPIASRLSRGPMGSNGLRALQRFFDEGGLVPLATGFGRSGNQKRGDASVGMLMRKAKVSSNLLKRSHHGFHPDAQELVRTTVAAGQVEFGGLIQPTATVVLPNGQEAPWISEIGLGETEYLISVLRASCYVLLAALTGMRDSELQGLRRGCVGQRDGLTVLYGTQYKGEQGFHGRDRYWWAPKPVTDAIKVLEQLTPHPGLFTRVRRSEKDPADDRGAYKSDRDIKRLIDFINADPSTRCGRGSGLGLEPIDVPRGMAINQTSLRRSFAVYAATTPGAEMGLGHQLGHWALRTTTGYASDGMQKAVWMLDDNRRQMVRSQVVDLLQAGTSVTGGPAEILLQIRAQAIASPERAEALEQDAAERYHLGVTNDCFYRPATAACGTDGPQLASHFCAADRCANAVFHKAHLPGLQGQVKRIDTRLDSHRLHPAFRAELTEERTRLAAHIRDLTNVEES